MFINVKDTIFESKSQPNEYTEQQIRIYKNGVLKATLTDGQSTTLTDGGSYSVITYVTLFATIYKDKSISYTISQSVGGTITYPTIVERTEIGKDGFYSYWNSLLYFYFSKVSGLKYSGAIDIPAGLGGGSATNSGGGYNTWGTVTTATRASTVVTINHGIGDTKYTVNVTPIGNYTWYAQNKGNNSIQIVCSGYFDFVLTRTPY